VHPHHCLSLSDINLLSVSVGVWRPQRHSLCVAAVKIYPLALHMCACRNTFHCHLKSICFLSTLLLGLTFDSSDLRGHTKIWCKVYCIFLNVLKYNGRFMTRPIEMDPKILGLKFGDSVSLRPTVSLAPSFLFLAFGFCLCLVTCLVIRCHPMKCFARLVSA